MQPWVKTSLAPGSKVVTDYLDEAGPDAVPRAARLQPRRLRLHDLHRQLAARCPTRSRDADRRAATWWRSRCSPATATSRGAINPEVRANYLASPPLVVAYALAGRIDVDLDNEPLGTGRDGEPVFLRDIWPTPAGDPRHGVGRAVRAEMFEREYGDVFTGDERWPRCRCPTGEHLRLGRRLDLRQAARRSSSGMPREPEPVEDIAGRARAGAARRLGHHRPHLAGRRDQARQPGRAVPDRARRRAEGLQLLRLAPRQPRGDDARHLRQRAAAQPARAGASRAAGRCTCPTASRCRSTTPRCATARRACRWSSSPARSTAPARRATGRRRARACSACGRSIAESYERIHRSNLIGMGVAAARSSSTAQSAESLGLTGHETLRRRGPGGGARRRLRRRPAGAGARARATTARRSTSQAAVRLDTPQEVEYYRHGGILQYVLRQLRRTAPGGPARQKKPRAGEGTGHGGRRGS